SLGVVAYQCLAGRVPFDADDSFSIGYKHIMEALPVPPLDGYDQHTLFEIVRKMMAKAPEDRFQTADELVQVLEAGGGFAAVGLGAAGPRAAAAATARPAAPRRSVAAGIALWVAVVAIGLGVPGLWAYRHGLLFFAHPPAADSTAAALSADTVAQRLLGDTGAAEPAESGAAPAVPTSRDSAAARAVAPGTPGRLTLHGLPPGAHVTLNGIA